jgi:outer membrane protein
MKKQLFAFTLAAALTVATAGYGQSPFVPAPTAAVKIGLINIQRAIIESNEGRVAIERLQKQFAPRQTDLQTRQAEIEKLQKQLREQEKTLSDEARASLVRQIEAKTKDFNRANEDATNEAQQAEAQAVNEIGQKMMKVLDEYARKYGYHVVFDVGSPQSPVLWASASVDLTDDVIKLYNSSEPAAGAATSGAAPPAARPAAKPATPAAKPATPAAKPAAEPAAKPATPPAAKKPGQ